jgi:hypothetical protein
MRSRVLGIAAILGAATTFACTGQVAVEAQLENAEGGVSPLKELPIRALPYNRDAIFDSLRTAYSTPEPMPPDSLNQLQAAIQQANDEWTSAEAKWNSARDSLRALKAKLDNTPRSSGEYRLLFRDFGDQEQRERTTQQQSQAAFRRYTDLQERYTAQAAAYKLQHEQWADEAYASVDEVIAAHIKKLGLEEIADTTDANGTRIMKLKKGQWWIYAYYPLVYEELYWNMPVEVTGGEPAVVLLNHESATKRPIY